MLMRGRSGNRQILVFAILMLMLTSILGACERPLGGGHYDAPLVRLLANPNKFDSKWVLTSGYLRFGVGGPRLFLSEGDAVHGVMANGVALAFSESQMRDKTLRSRVDGRYVAVTGLFKALGTGDSILNDVDVALVYSPKDGEED